MKIGMILDSAFPPDPRVENEAATLIGAGHEVHLFCLDYSGRAETREILHGIHVYRVALPKHVYLFSALAHTLPYYHWVLRKHVRAFVAETGVESLHIHDIQSARAVFWANRRTRLPTVLDLHENRPEIMRHYAHVNSRMGKLLISPRRWRKFEYAFIRKADTVITVTEEAAQHYVDQTGVSRSKFHVVPNTVRKSFYTDFEVDDPIVSRYADNFTLLYLGDTGLRRGLLTAIASLKYLTEEVPNIKLVIVGRGKEDDRLMHAVAAGGWQSYVDFVGWVDMAEFPSYILGCHIGICPLHRNLHHDTTYANKLFQYMAFAKPILVSDCTAQRQLVERFGCGEVFVARDEVDFARKVVALAKQPHRYAEMAKNAKEAIDNHLNWEILSVELREIYRP